MHKTLKLTSNELHTSAMEGDPIMTTMFPIEDPNATYGTCPRCGENTLRTDRPVMNALSRTDNETYVCNGCGTAEGIEDFVSQSMNIRTQANWQAPQAATLKRNPD